MTRNTPGPWTRDEHRVITSNRNIWFTQRWLGIAKPKELEANADLIAAAPELRDALRRLMAAYESIFPGVASIAVKDYALINEAPIEAARALAKAEGHSLP